MARYRDTDGVTMTVRDAIHKMEADGATDWEAIIAGAVELSGGTRARAMDVYRMEHPEQRHDGRGGKSVPKSSGAGRSLANFRSTYDKDTIIPAKIQAALTDLGESWEYESEFVRRLGIGYADLGNYRDRFADHIVFIRRDSKRVWAGTVQLAVKLKEML